MNEKKVKALRRRVKPFRVEWLKTLLTDEEGQRVSIDNIDSLAPKQDYYSTKGTILLSFMTPKWIMKTLKKHPYIDSFSELSIHYEDWRRKNKDTLKWIL
jgi:hypothetical protein|tara:strand:- start:200 stop:499 length:300 start_codon:yes stop_codon:yes gene_type:complete